MKRAGCLVAVHHARSGAAAEAAAAVHVSRPRGLCGGGGGGAELGGPVEALRTCAGSWPAWRARERSAVLMLGGARRLSSGALALCRVMHINDVYRLDHLARLRLGMDVREAEAAARGAELGCPVKVLRTLSGDFLSPNALSPIDSGRSFMRAFNAVGISHFSLGNHEADLDAGELEKRMGECQGAVVNTNVPGYDRPSLPRCAVVDVSGVVRVGVLGLVARDRAVFKDLAFKGHPIMPVLAAAQATMLELRGQGVAHFLLLTHQAMEQDRELARALQGQGVLAVLGGHDHTPFDEEVAGTRVVKAGQNAEACGVLDLVFRAEGGVSVEYRRVAVGELAAAGPAVMAALPPRAAAAAATALKADLEVGEIVTAANALTKQFESEELWELGRPLSATGSRFRQTELGALLMDCVRAETGAEIAVVNGASIKALEDVAPDGVITFAALKEALPFPVKYVAVRMRGSVLQDALRWARTHPAGWHEQKRGFLQLDSGVDVEAPTVCGDFAPEGELGAAGSDTMVRVSGEPFVPDRDYLVACPRNLLAGFCEIVPLVEWAAQNRDRLRGNDDYTPIMDLIMRDRAQSIWCRLGSFEEIDGNGDGFISRRELQARVQVVLHHYPSEDLTDYLTAALDGNADGDVSKDEWDQLKRILRRANSGVSSFVKAA
jgi:2',3'-cyclic-nucleotide 2'-phosphodiesterase (5'-nucleotidase family)